MEKTKKNKTLTAPEERGQAQCAATEKSKKTEQSEKRVKKEDSRIPVIGIVPQIDMEGRFHHVRLFPNYMKVLDACGAAGIMLPFTHDRRKISRLLEICDGFLLTGGQDINPELYGDVTSGTSEYAPVRDTYEPVLFPMILETGKPVLAVCRGMQMLNVLAGGTLTQDLPDENSGDSKMKDFILHPDWKHPLEGVHRVHVRPGTQFRQITGTDSIMTNSLHHQGIKKIGNGLTVSGVSDDGLVEALEIDALEYGIGVQWHPEELFEDDETSQRLFRSFVEASRG